MKMAASKDKKKTRKQSGLETESYQFDEETKVQEAYVFPT
jgi:hypothetical protein